MRVNARGGARDGLCVPAADGLPGPRTRGRAPWREAGRARPVPSRAEPDPARFDAAWDEFSSGWRGNYPFFHPRYAGQMLKPPHPVAAAAYVAAMHVNPNNHALDGGPATSEMEKEVVARLAAMFGLPGHLGHLTASGHDREPRGAVGGARAAPGQGDRVRRRRPLHARAHVRRARRRRPRDPPTPTAGSTSTRSTPRCATGEIGTVVLTPARPGSARSTTIDEALALRERTACASTSTPRTAASSRCSHDGAVAGRAVPGDRRRRLGRDRPAQARPAAIRMRRRAVPRPGRGAPVHARLAVHVLHVAASCTWARSASSARARAPPRRRCG